MALRIVGSCSAEERMPPMERLLPNRRLLVIALRAIVVLGFAGCSSQQMSASNPFMAPDRVPPPATRTIAPGTAAPYYPGDPMPAAQTAVTNPTMTAQALVPSATVAAAPAMPTPQAIAFGNERSVSIPTDNENLRFSVPPPPVAEQPQAEESAPQVAAVPAAQAVSPASFNQPVPSQPVPEATPIPTASAENSGGLWRSPEVPGSTTPVMHAQYVQPQSSAPTTLSAQPANPWISAAPQPMPVELRPVASPAGAPTMASTQQVAVAPQTTMPPPRMRFPSFTSPSTWFTPQPAPAANQQLIGYMVPGPNGTQHMVSVEQYQAMTSGAVVGATQPAESVASSDGFRPRGTATK
jgi:hypothetical protein